MRNLNSERFNIDFIHHKMLWALGGPWVSMGLSQDPDGGIASDART